MYTADWILEYTLYEYIDTPTFSTFNFFSLCLQATDKVTLLLVFMAAVFVFVPLRYTILCLYLEAFTRELSYRKESSDKWLRRLREWWFRIPAAPVQLIKAEDKKKKKR